MERVEALPDYKILAQFFDAALEQAQAGKGKERHASGEPFEEQQICEITRRVGDGGALYQVVKKTYESQRLPGERGENELLGAAVYLGAAWLLRRERRLVEEAKAAEETATPKTTLSHLKIKLDASEAKVEVRAMVEELQALQEKLDRLRGRKATSGEPTLRLKDISSGAKVGYSFLSEAGIADISIRGLDPEAVRKLAAFFESVPRT